MKRPVGILSLAALLAASLAGTPALAQDGACGPLANHYGPYDYRKDRGPTLDVVERRHFPLEVEMLRPYRTESPGTNIAYTLHTFPNHHRALVAMAKLAEKEKRDPPRDARYTVDCYFERALRFRPDDTVARLLYTQHLVAKAKLDEARVQLEETTRLAGENPFTHYNIGLVYLDMKDYDKALQQAQRAMALGFPRTDLKDALSSAGKWREPAAAASASAPASAASAP